MHDYYATRAPYYDAVYAKPERADIAWLQTTLPEVFAGRQVLEIACGTGYWTPWIARTAQRLVATDGTAEPLNLARSRPGCGTVHFQRADAYALPAELQGFDAAFAGLWFSHVPRERQAEFLDGLHGRLQPGARVVMIDNNEVQLRDWPIAETDAHGNTWQHRATHDGVVHPVLKNFPTEAEWRALLADRATDIEWRMLENFWWISYRLR
ncbi:MAG: class I SAM-dependent methyltransferase [Inhella sp.]